MADNIRARLTTAVADRYTVERELGGGGMSRVFVALEHALGRRVVIKTLTEDATFGDAAAQRFRSEILTAARIEHANIVPVLSAGDIEGIPYFIMPWVDGDSLRQLLQRGPVPIPQAISILRDVARALAAAHSNGVAHRDIKPENILLSGGAARVTDFGVAKALSAATHGGVNANATNAGLTGIGMSIGTPAYMAPEQLAADPALDHRADIYAWGLVAYEVLSGHHPFEGLSGTALMQAQLGALPQELRSREAPVSPALSALVMKALSKDPAERPQTANELIAALDESSVVSGETSRGPASDATRVRASNGAGSSPANSMLGIAKALGVAALAAAGIFGVWKFTRPDVAADDRVIAVAPFKVSGAPADVRYLREGVADLIVPQLSSFNGIRPSSSRQMFDSWKRAANSMDNELPEDEARAVARSIGAGQIILGEITGAGHLLVITAHLSRVTDKTGSTGIKSDTVMGAADSIVAMTARLTTKLILGRDSTPPERVRAVMRAKPEAITSFLNGERFYRSGRYADALKQFASSYAADSTFPLVPLRIYTVNGWLPTGALDGPWVQRALAYRQKLTGADSMLLEAYADPALPTGTPPLQNMQRMWDIALRANSAEVWYVAADAYMHNGMSLGDTTALTRALDGFKRAEAIDSSYVGGIEHQSILYFVFGDTTSARAADRRQARIDSTGDFYRVSNTFLRTGLAKPAEQATIAHEIAQDSSGFATSVLLMHSLMTSLPVPLDRTVLDSVVASKKLRSSLVSGTVAAQAVHEALLNTGRISEAQQPVLRDTTLLGLAHSVLEALYWDSDTVIAANAIERIRRRQKGNRDTTGTVANNLPRLAFALWSVDRGDTSAARQVLNEFRSYRAPASNASLGYPTKIYGKLLESRLAVKARAPNAKALIADIDSVLVATPRLDRRDVRTLANLMIAGMYAEVGDAASALRVSRRRDMQLASPAYASTFVRLRADAAEKAGDREEAIRSLRAYIELQAKADAHLQPDVQSARERLKALEKKS